MEKTLINLIGDRNKGGREASRKYKKGGKSKCQYIQLRQPSEQLAGWPPVSRDSLLVTLVTPRLPASAASSDTFFQTAAPPLCAAGSPRELTL